MAKRARAHAHYPDRARDTQHVLAGYTAEKQRIYFAAWDRNITGPLADAYAQQNYRNTIEWMEANASIPDFYRNQGFKSQHSFQAWLQAERIALNV
jgi:hypothetical protein